MRRWPYHGTITIGLLDAFPSFSIFSIPMLLKTVQSKRMDASHLITHRFKLADMLQAYETFSNAADTCALKVIVEA